MESDDCFTARNYQEALLSVALKQNTIIFLPTGAGKTYIALLLLKRLSQDLNKPYSAGGKISILLANTVALVAQHATYIEVHTDFKVNYYTGDKNVDFWTRQKWFEEFTSSQVLVMTAQILCNLISNQFIDLNYVNLVIFDECHQGVDDHSMRVIMKYFEHVDNPPHVLGLTATLLNGNCKLASVMEHVRQLEVTFRSQVATVDGLEEVVGFSTNPREKFLFFNEQTMPDYVQELLMKIDQLQELLQIIKSTEAKQSLLVDALKGPNLRPLICSDTFKSLRNLIKDTTYHFEALGVYGGYISIITSMIKLVRMRKVSEDFHDYSTLDYVFTTYATLQKELCKKYFENISAFESRHCYQVVTKFSTNKVLSLLSILKEHLTNQHQDLCMLIFTQRRQTAKILYHILQSCGDEFPNIKPDFVVGTNTNPFKDTREGLYMSKKNKEVLHRFKNKDINILICSNILEEGIDIPCCSIVIKFDRPEDYRSYVQSKGRARHKDSIYYTFISQLGSEKYVNKYSQFQAVESVLNDYLVGRNKDRCLPSESEIQSIYHEDAVPPYFVSGPNSPCVTMLTAISLLCRYCQCLPSDIYTNYAPEWYIETYVSELRTLHRVTIFLPMICPIKYEIKGRPMLSKKNAKRSAALEACIKLHECKELTDDLLPRPNGSLTTDTSFLFKHWPTPDEIETKKFGGAKKKGLHKNTSILEVHDVIETVYLHAIQIKALFPADETIAGNKLLHDLLVSEEYMYGIVTAERLPDSLFAFPLFISMGKLEIRIRLNVMPMVMTKELLHQIKFFHHMIFAKLLEVVKPFLVLPNCGSNIMYAVPIRRTGINKFELITDFLATMTPIKPKCQQMPALERMNLKVDPDEYLYRAISPWYRGHTQMYIVISVEENITPLSMFPNESFSTYEQYYGEKHNLKILNKTQPLLHVKALSSKMTLYKPRSVEAKRKRDKRLEDIDEYLLPELVIKQDYPGALCVQAILLPSIMARLTFMLRIEQFRNQLLSETNLKRPKSDNNSILEVDFDDGSDYKNTSLEEIEEQIDDSKRNNSLDITESVIASTSLVAFNRDFKNKVLEADYPWKDLDEPIDIERNIMVSIMDIEHYESFIQKPIIVPSQEPKQINDRIESIRNTKLAIGSTPKEYVHKDIKMINMNNSKEKFAPSLIEMYRAMCTHKANDVVNLERLEVLGDSFLKFAASIYIMSKFSKFNEGDATTLKSKLISNKNLYYLAIRKQLGGIIKSVDFRPQEHWLPPGYSIPKQVVEMIDSGHLSIRSLFSFAFSDQERISGNLSQQSIKLINEEAELLENDSGITVDPDTNDPDHYINACQFLNCQYLPDKSVADCVEALIGAHFEAGGITSALTFLKWMEIIPQTTGLQKILQKNDSKVFDDEKFVEVNLVQKHLPQYLKLEQQLGYTFNNRGLLLQAMTHPSYTMHRVTMSYERLEFIGDAILDFLITTYIYENFKHLDPGKVTDLRSALVNNNTFASLVVRNHFHKYMLFINSKLLVLIDKFEEYLKTKHYKIDDEILILLQEDDLNIAEYVDVPKALGDVFESLAGAVYLDSGYCLHTVWRVFYKMLWNEIDMFSKNIPINIIRQLYEYPNAYPLFSEPIKIANGKTMVRLEFMCNGQQTNVHGFGNNKFLAKKAAAKIALKSLKL